MQVSGSQEIVSFSLAGCYVQEAQLIEQRSRRAIHSVMTRSSLLAQWRRTVSSW